MTDVVFGYVIGSVLVLVGYVVCEWVRTWRKP